MPNNTYDDFSQDYDRFVNWDSRLQAEIPFVEARLSELDLPNGQKAGRSGRSLRNGHARH